MLLLFIKKRILYLYFASWLCNFIFISFSWFESSCFGISLSLCQTRKLKDKEKMLLIFFSFFEIPVLLLFLTYSSCYSVEKILPMNSMKDENVPWATEK
jgi:hypothetical protein